MDLPTPPMTPPPTEPECEPVLCSTEQIQVENPDQPITKKEAIIQKILKNGLPEGLTEQKLRRLTLKEIQIRFAESDPTLFEYASKNKIKKEKKLKEIEKKREEIVLSDFDPENDDHPQSDTESVAFEPVVSQTPVVEPTPPVKIECAEPVCEEFETDDEEDICEEEDAEQNYDLPETLFRFYCMFPNVRELKNVTFNFY